VAELAQAIITLDKEWALSAVQAAIEAGRDPLDLIDDAQGAMEEVGKKFEEGEYYLMELMRAGHIFKGAAEVLNPIIKERHGGVAEKGTILLGTVAGDIHDLGKNIVGNLLECRGFEVIDLGVGVANETFVEKIREIEPNVVGLSALLTASIPQMKAVIEAVEAAGLREGIKVIAGGGIVGEVNESEIKANHTTANANEGIKVIDQWIQAQD
jgi:5-methyltetrahydrofolate--homocysteine methyltransferase